MSARSLAERSREAVWHPCTQMKVHERFPPRAIVAADGRVSIEKSYRGRHSVLYEGQFDGEGRMWGVWALPGYDGRWMIELGRAAMDGPGGAADPFAPRDLA